MREPLAGRISGRLDMNPDNHRSKSQQPDRPHRKRRGFLASLTRLEENEKGGDSWFVSVCLASLIFAAAYVLIELKPSGLFNIIAYTLALAALGTGP